MLTLIFSILLIVVMIKIIAFAIKATWGITKVIFSVVLFPLVLIGLVLGGLVYLAIPILIIVGLVALFKKK